MTKAALLQGQIGTAVQGAQICVKALLQDTFRLCHWLSECFRCAEAEQLLLEVQQVNCSFVGLMLVDGRSQACSPYSLALA